MLANDFRLAVDVDAFAEACGLEGPLDDWQRRVLESRRPKLLLNCCRQSGKSTVAALLAVRTLVYEPGSLVLLVSPSLRQSAELLRKAVTFFGALPGRPEVALESASRLELIGGSRVISLPGTEKTLRGFSKARLIVLDEAARIDDGLIAGIRPMQAVAGSDAKMVALSTPFGRRGWFFERWRQQGRGSSGWGKVELPAERCPRITPEFLEEELRELGPLRFDQEYRCQFVDDQAQLFASAIIERAFSDDVEPLFTRAA